MTLTMIPTEKTAQSSSNKGTYNKVGPGRGEQPLAPSAWMRVVFIGDQKYAFGRSLGGAVFG